ncbi:MAG: thioesterase family protein [Flavobacteriaceae bacterium]
MEVFEKTVTVQEVDLDQLEHVNNVRYIEWIQDISREHWEKRASKEIKKEVVWVVLSHHVQYKAQARLGDIIRIKTFIEETRGAISVRAVEMRDANTDSLLVKSKTEWCLLGAKLLKPMRISQEIRSLFEPNPKSIN